MIRREASRVYHLNQAVKIGLEGEYREIMGSFTNGEAALNPYEVVILEDMHA